jgi:hypothetical protein
MTKAKLTKYSVRAIVLAEIRRGESERKEASKRFWSGK